MNNNKNEKSINPIEVILIILVGLAISYVFYIEFDSLSKKLMKTDEQILNIQTEVVNLRLKINALENKNISINPIDEDSVDN